MGMESTPERLLGEEETEKEGVMREKPEKADLSKELNKVVKVNESVLVDCQQAISSLLAVHLSTHHCNGTPSRSGNLPCKHLGVEDWPCYSSLGY